MKNNAGRSLLVLCALILVVLGAFGIIQGLTSQDHGMHSSAAEAMDDSMDHSMMAKPAVGKLVDVAADCSDDTKCQADSGDAPKQDAPPSEHGDGHASGRKPKIYLQYQPLP
jgi:hypothetical protein